MSAGTTKTTPARRRATRERSDLRREYRFDYDRSRPNRFAPLFKGRQVAVVLDADVAAVFGSSESVNSLLRSVIAALPARASGRRRRG